MRPAAKGSAISLSSADKGNVGSRGVTPVEPATAPRAAFNCPAHRPDCRIVETLAMENALLREAHLEMETKLKQLAHHRVDYVATLSHELRTPLTSIKGFAQLLMRESEDAPEAVHKYAGTIAAEADKLALIVADIVDLTRMETGLLELHRRPISLGQLVHATAERLQPMVLPQRLAVRVPQRLPTVMGDPDRLDQLLERMLLDAAGHASPASTLLLAAEAGDDGVALRLEYPTGEEQIALLNEALQGLNSHCSDGQATQLGRGRLGLYISKNYIEALGGKMWIERPKERVVWVVFTLPY